MNKLLFIFLFVFYCGPVKLSAQINLVPNPSFEDTVGCPYYYSDIDSAQYWFNPAYNAGTSDYFNSCSSSNQCSIPFNYLMGFQLARTGNAYAGFSSFYNYPDPGYPEYKNYREYIAVKLIQPLEPNHTYAIEFFLAPANKEEYAVANIGALVCNSSLIPSFVNQTPIIAQPQFESPDNFFVVDTANWTRISGTISANGGEDYLIIGNFRDSASINSYYVGNYGSYIDPINFNQFDSANYYAIDDVSLVDVTPRVSVPNVFTPNGDGINDIFILSDTSVNQLSCWIYNRWGNEIVMFTGGNNNGWNGKNKDGNECPDGVYHYIISAKGFDEKEYNWKGFVQLLR